jgi:hypothetical protein
MTGRLRELARRRAAALDDQRWDEGISEMRNGYLARLPGRASAEQIEAVANMPRDLKWFREVERILGITLAGAILREILQAMRR